MGAWVHPPCFPDTCRTLQTLKGFKRLTICIGNMLSLETHTRFGVPHPLVKHTEDVTAVRKLRTPAGRHVHYSSDDTSVNKVTPQLAVHGRPPPPPPPSWPGSTSSSSRSLEEANTSTPTPPVSWVNRHFRMGVTVAVCDEPSRVLWGRRHTLTYYKKAEDLYSFIFYKRVLAL